MLHRAPSCCPCCQSQTGCANSSTPPQHSRRNLWRFSRCLVSSPRRRGSSPHQLGLTIQHAGLGQEERPPPPQYLQKLRKRTSSKATKDAAGCLHVPLALPSDNSTTRWKKGNFTQGAPGEWQDADIYLLSTTGSPRRQVGYTVL